MLHPHTELRTVDETIGYGVFATRDIPRGTITWALDPFDQVVGEPVLAGLDEDFEELLVRYTWINARGERILCWDFARFMNHHCQANTLWPGGFDIEIAVRHIRSGEQITCDYGALNLEEPFSCSCGGENCRGTVRPDDFETHAGEWDDQIRAAFPDILHVEQPLWRIVKDLRVAIQRGARRPHRLASVLRHRYLPEDLASERAAAESTSTGKTLPDLG